jgi:hypothetical protein
VIEPEPFEPGVYRMTEADCRYCGQPCRTYRPGSTAVAEEGCVKLRRRIHLVATMEITSQVDLDLLEERVHDEMFWTARDSSRHEGE